MIVNQLSHGFNFPWKNTTASKPEARTVFHPCVFEVSKPRRLGKENCHTEIDTTYPYNWEISNIIAARGRMEQPTENRTYFINRCDGLHFSVKLNMPVGPYSFKGLKCRKTHKIFLQTYLSCIFMCSVCFTCAVFKCIQLQTCIFIS